MVLTAVGVMAIGAGTAQAQLPGESKLGSFTVAGSGALAENLTATGAGEGSVSLSVPGRNLRLECDPFHIAVANIFFRFIIVLPIFLKCKAYALAEGGLIEGCNVTNGGEIKASAILLPVLHGGNAYVLAEPQEAGGNLAVVTFESGKGCVLPLNNPVKGSFVGQVTSGLESVKPLITFSQAIQELGGDKLLFGTFPAYLNASVTMELTGSHTGLKLGVH